MQVDKFLSDEFGYPCYSLAVEAPAAAPARLQDVCSAVKGKCFVSAKVPVSDIEAVSVLLREGFILADTNITFHRAEGRGDPYAIVGGIRHATPDDEGAVAEIAGAMLIQNRFCRDSQIPAGLGRRVKERWVRNYFRGKRGEFMVVAEIDGEIVGFNQLRQPETGTLVIDQIAVTSGAQGTGVARALVEFPAKDISSYFVGTQLCNSRSVKFYQKAGFRFHKAEHVLHLHRP